MTWQILPPGYGYPVDPERISAGKQYQGHFPMTLQLLLKKQRLILIDANLLSGQRESILRARQDSAQRYGCSKS